MPTVGLSPLIAPNPIIKYHPAMRIISGTLKGRALKALPGESTRPAMGRTREALFSMLDARAIDWPSIDALDLFAGTGSLGFEAISRGARSALFVDTGEEQTRLVAANAKLLGIADKCETLRQDALRFLRKPPDRRFGLVLIDPPYRQQLGIRSLRALALSPIAGPGAFVAAELESGLQPKTPDGWEPIATRQFGQTTLHLWKTE